MGGGVRSSARLSGGGGGGGGGGGRAAPHADAEAAAAARSAAAHSAARAAAAERRARAAERAREVEDSPRVLRDKCRRLARALTEAKHLVVYTGAGISTAADIPDYRGPRGVWTRLRRGETVGRVEVARARPTFTHMALTALWARGLLKFVVSQNCDGLHLRAGLPRRALAELHGDMFAEQCAACRRVYLRTFDTTERTARHAHGTRRLCHACGRELRDTIVHFGERGRAAWPLNWAGALRHAAAADVVLCLGSSLKVLRRYPRLWRMQRAPHARPALYIVNLQWTPKDAAAALKINARCDTVMAAVARRLRLRVPRYSARGDPLLAHAVPLAPLEAHTARGAPLSPPPLGADSDSDACYTLSSPSSPSSTSSPSDEDESDASGSGADTSDPDDRVPLGRLAERLRASRAQRPPAPPAPTPPPPAPSAASHDYYTKPITPQPRRESPAREELPSDGLRSFQVSMSTCEATILLRAEHAPSALPPPPEPPPAPHAPHAPHAAPVSLPTVSGVTQPRSSNAAPCKRQCLVPACVSEARAPTAELRRYRMYRPAGPAQADGFSRTNGHLSPTEPDRNFNSVSVPTVKTEEETLGNGAWGGGSRLQRLLECAPRDLDEAPIKVDKTEPWTKLKVEPEDADEAVADRKCKVQLPVSARRQFGEVKSELGGTCKSLLPCASPTRSEGAAAAAAAAQLEEMGEAEAAAAAFIRRAVLVCRASLYPGLHTILGGARGCAWCTRRYGARRCLWYGAPPDAGTVRTARRLRGRRYLCACCPAHSSHSSHSARSAPASPLPDDAGWYGKGYRKGRRRRR